MQEYREHAKRSQVTEDCAKYCVVPPMTPVPGVNLAHRVFMVSLTKKVGKKKRQINFKRCYNLTLKDKKVNVSSLPKKSKHNRHIILVLVLIVQN